MAVMSISEDLAEAKAAPTEKSDPIDVIVNGKLYVLTFAKAPGQEWASATSKCPPRPDVPLDRVYGYNLHAVIPEIAPSTCTVTKDGEPVELVTEPWSLNNPQPMDQWRDLFSVIDGGAFARIADAVFELNQWGPDQRTAALGKASRVDSVPSSDSPES